MTQNNFDVKFWVWVVRGLQLRQHLALQASQVCHSFSLHTYSRASQLLFRVYAFKFYGCLAQHCNKQVSLKDSAVILLLGTGKVLLRVPSSPVILKGSCVLQKERGLFRGLLTHLRLRKMLGFTVTRIRDHSLSCVEYDVRI